MCWLFIKPTALTFGVTYIRRLFVEEMDLISGDEESLLRVSCYDRGKTTINIYRLSPVRPVKPVRNHRVAAPRK